MSGVHDEEGLERRVLDTLGEGFRSRNLTTRLHAGEADASNRK